MSEAVIVRPDPEPIRQANATLIQGAHAVAVRDVATHGEALGILGHIGTAEKRIKDAFREPKRKAHEAHRAITALEAELLAPLTEARRIVSAKCATFEAEQRRLADEERERKIAEETARRETEEAERRELAAAMADTEEAREEILTAPEEPLAPPQVEVPVAVAKVAGISTRQTWRAEVTDKRAFVTWCLAHDQLYLLEPNLPLLNQLAKNQHEELAIDGVRAIASLVHAVR